jgi:tRNA-modifying protein YgfZ
MAPEAERNASTISYVKGCYLGQEPIARLDAMGHVNRALRCVESSATPDQLLNANLLNADKSSVGTVTSAASTPHGTIGLAIVRANAIQNALHCVVDGQSVDVKVMSPITNSA